MRSFSTPSQVRRGRLDRRSCKWGAGDRNSWNATQEAISACGDLTDKVVIDCTNPIGKDGLTTSGAEQVAEWAKEQRSTGIQPNRI